MSISRISELPNLVKRLVFNGLRQQMTADWAICKVIFHWSRIPPHLPASRVSDGVRKADTGVRFRSAAAEAPVRECHGKSTHKTASNRFRYGSPECIVKPFNERPK